MADKMDETSQILVQELHRASMLAMSEALRKLVNGTDQETFTREELLGFAAMAERQAYGI